MGVIYFKGVFIQQNFKYEKVFVCEPRVLFICYFDYFGQIIDCL